MDRQSPPAKKRRSLLKSSSSTGSSSRVSFAGDVSSEEDGQSEVESAQTEAAPFSLPLTNRWGPSSTLSILATATSSAPGSEKVEFVRKSGGAFFGIRFVAVDRFKKKECFTYCFLTHAHTDHLEELNNKWTQHIYCSEETAAILPILTRTTKTPGVKPSLLRPLKVGVTHTISPNFQVTLIDANHCFGAVMFLFEGATVPGGAILCTGDFRADDEYLARLSTHEAGRRLLAANISTIFFDNTYLSHIHDFNSLASARQQIRDVAMANPEAILIIPSYRLGREEVLEELSAATGESIALHPYRWAVYSKRKKDNLLGGIVGHYEEKTADSQARIFTTEKRAGCVTRAIKMLLDNQRYVVLDISLESDLQSYLPDDSVVPIKYSDHSSRREIINFLSCLSFADLVPMNADMSLKDAKELLCLSRKEDNVVQDDQPSMENGDPTSEANNARSVGSMDDGEELLATDPLPESDPANTAIREDEVESDADSDEVPETDPSDIPSQPEVVDILDDDDEVFVQSQPSLAPISSVSSVGDTPPPAHPMREESSDSQGSSVQFVCEHQSSKSALDVDDVDLDNLMCGSESDGDGAISHVINWGQFLAEPQMFKFEKNGADLSPLAPELKCGPFPTANVQLKIALEFDP